MRKRYTYETLLADLTKLTPEQLNCDVTIFNYELDEYCSPNRLKFATPEETDVLDENHPYLTI